MPAGAGCEIRIGRDEDADAISAVIRAALRHTNAADYPATVIERLVETFGPAEVRALMARRLCLVALWDGRVAGTASLEGDAVRSVFVAPDIQGRGVGRQLMAAIERAAQERHVGDLFVQSSLSAEPFYARLGFVAVRDHHFGDERTIIMRRSLPAGGRSP